MLPDGGRAASLSGERQADRRPTAGPGLEHLFWVEVDRGVEGDPS
jgi:hypothetical protein